jgi:CHAT domain-containing protein
MVLLIPSIGSVTHVRTHAAVWSEAPVLQQLRNTGNALFRSGQYAGAIQVYQTGYDEARSRGDTRSAVRFLNNLGSSEYQLYRFRDAIKAYLDARDLAESQGDTEMLAALHFNLSSLYFQMGEMEAATESARRGLSMPGTAVLKFRPKLLIQSAQLQMRRKDRDQAIRSLNEAIDAARLGLDQATEATAWNELGDVLLESGRLDAANHALLESFRLRKLNHDDRIHYSFESLAKLCLRQNDTRSASLLFERAIQSSQPLGPAAVWSSYYERGRANLAQGHKSAAFADLAMALGKLRSWRAEVLPAEAFRISKGVELHQVFSDFIRSASELYRETGQERFAEQAFTAAEQSRALSLQALWAGSDLTNELPREYWQTLSQLQRAESDLLGNEPAAGTDVLRGLRLKLAEMETRAGIDLPPLPMGRELSDNPLPRVTRPALGPDEVVLSFYAGNPESYVWALTAGGLEFQRLPSEADLRQSVSGFVSALRESSDRAPALGAGLYDQLFGKLRPSTVARQKWVLVPDGPLFDLPFAALLENPPAPARARTYLIERHDLRIVTSVAALPRSPLPEPAGLFIGVGDPIYNRADVRLPAAVRQPVIPAALPPGAFQTAGMELPRLPGSAREIDSCAGIWRASGGRSIVLEGREANKQRLERALQEGPAVLHLATHVLFPPNDAGPGMLALSLEPERRLQFLSATEIANMRANIGLVVLDGCSSAHAPSLPGAGLMGMTRAWLTAGARAVIATRWAAADQDEGELFHSLYRLYFTARRNQRPPFSSMLRESQLAELKAGGRHADPAYWASYFCVERD